MLKLVKDSFDAEDAQELCDDDSAEKNDSDDDSIALIDWLIDNSIESPRCACCNIQPNELFFDGTVRLMSNDPSMTTDRYVREHDETYDPETNTYICYVCILTG